jgi:hypothetical protein
MSKIRAEYFMGAILLQEIDQKHICAAVELRCNMTPKNLQNS